MTTKRFLKSFFCTLIFSMAALTYNSSLANTPFNITVLYPEVRKPYSTFFEHIITSIKSNSSENIVVQSIDKTMNNADIIKILYKNNSDAVIFLGGSFKSIHEQIKKPIKVIYGASFFSNKDIAEERSGISIAPEPALLFKELKALKPSIKKIHVVFHNETNGWLIKRARVSAKETGITLVEHPAQNTQSAAIAYRKIVKYTNHAETALWLLQHDPTLDSKGLLPKILSDAWSHNQVILSSNPTHVRRGALLSLLPDHKQLGKDLAKTAISSLKGRNKHIQPMRSSLAVINIRTANHLSLTLSPKQQSNFALIYPRKK